MDLNNFMFRVESILGSGTFGVVYLCHDLQHNSRVCVKSVKVRSAVEIKAIRSEIYILSQINHPRIVNFLESIIIDPETIAIVMEYVPGGTLKDIIAQSSVSSPNDETVCLYICDIIWGLEYLHIRHVVHRDLKPENILIDDQGHLKIADFGISAVKHTNNIHDQNNGSPLYMSPECYLGTPPNFQADIWALGLICFEIVSGRNPLEHMKSVQEIQRLFKCSAIRYFPCLEIRRPWRALCVSCLQFDPKQRISTPELISKNTAITLHYYNQYFNYNY